ncbi:hypothetical protein [Ancylobacter pratisalsi]|uniref:Uncharacterized protein n=1 Tax=Ancylobacter pratisalsi TaxID=1745854 RepID=A0A6P1YUP3_9HYPH|nr:hypothetical protein [Ancylobacter pratisalsi]QIB35813.1 hypothetical protein G3A50_20425 [Ancylobacter pratisalsi]
MMPDLTNLTVEMTKALAALDRRPPDPELSWLPLPLPSREELEMLRSNGATEWALREVKAWPVVFSPTGFFRLARHDGEGEPAFVTLVRDVWEVGIDLVAWSTREPCRIARRDGAAATLGEGMIANRATFASGRPVRVFRDALSWLRHDRNGLVIVDPVGAALRLADAPRILAENPAHARELAARLSPHVAVERILAPRAAERAA